MRRALILALLLLAAPAAAQTIVGGRITGAQIAALSPPPTIDSFSSNAANPCTAPCSHTLTWATTNATTCTGSQTIGTDFAGAQAVDGTDAVSASLPTTYTLTCTGPGGSDATPTVTVNTLPAVPSSFNCTDSATGGAISCSWSHAAPSTVDHYDFAYCLDSTGCDVEGEWTIESGATSPESRSGLTDDVLYRARVRAVDSASGASAYATDTVTPTAGSGLAATFTGPCEVTDTNADELDDCYCTRVSGNGADGTSDVLYDASLLGCEDFDDPHFWDETRHAEFLGDPGEGPPYDQTGCGYRGCNQFWGAALNACSWHSGEPASPKFGSSCGFATCGGKIYDTTPDYPNPGDTDPWDADIDACMWIFEPGEDPGHSSAAITDGVATGGNAFAGNASIEWVTAPGIENGINRSMSFGGGYTEVGITLAIYHTDNYATAGAFGQAIKGDELTPTGDFIFWGGSSNSGSNSPFGAISHNYPFSGFAFNGGAQSACNASNAANPATIGYSACNSVAWYWWRGVQDGRMPLGSWQCIRAHVKGVNSSAGELHVWWGDTKVFEQTNIDAGNIWTATSYSGYDFDAYHNNYASLSSTIGRGQDNVHVRNGVPVSCEQIGFPAP